MTLDRRSILKSTGMSLGALAATSQLAPKIFAQANEPIIHHQVKAKRIIHLFMGGGPSHVDTFDYKPMLQKKAGEDLAKLIKIPRLSGMTSGKKTFPVTPSIFKFKQHGQSGAWVSDLFPHLSKIVDDISFIKSMTSTHVNHDPAITFCNSGHAFPGRPCLGSWVNYGLGSTNQNLPGFTVLSSQGNYHQAQPLNSRLWSAGFLPSRYQGVKLRAAANPVLHLHHPAGLNRNEESDFLKLRNQLDMNSFQHSQDPEILTRISQYEMAYRMQSSIPEITDMHEPESTYKLYGEDAKKPGTFAANCLLARRMIEKDVRCIQLFHTGWDHHGNVPKYHPILAKEVDQACAGLITDLKQRGLLEDTLIVWGGEFGRTVFSQGGNAQTYGRDHHPYAFTYWLAGGGIKPGVTHGKTDEFGQNVTENPVDMHDLHATILHLMGIDHERLNYKFQGRYFRLTDVHGKVIKPLLA